jgi:glycosyltransferase involved in cell wall biosynthesis
MTVLGVRRIILGLHSRPSYQRFIVAKPVLKLMHSVGLLKGIHAVNIIDTMILRNTLDLPVWWIPNGINCEKFRPGEKREGFQVIFVGALSEDKGIDTYLKAAELAKNKYGDVDFVVVSTGGHLKNLVVEAQSKGLVRFLGFIPQEELPRLYAESHVAVFPSKDEAFPLVSLEAQASGTPVIATDIAAFRQSIINSATGLLVKPCTPEAFADAIIRVKELWDRNKDEYMKMSMNARRNSENYCWDKIVRIYCKKFFG